MRKKKPDPSRCAEQRNKAEIPVAEGEGVAPSRSGRDLTGLVRELQKHQIELETENEELRKAREAIEESRARYADLYDSAPMGCFSLDDEGRIQEANLTGARLLGSERSHLKDTSLAHFLAPQSRGAFDAHRRAVLRNGSRESRELEFERRDGTRFWGLLESVPVDADDRTVRSVLTDITERKQVDEERLRLARIVMERTLDGVIIWTPDGRIQEVNDAFCRMSGYEREEVTGKPVGVLRSLGHTYNQIQSAISDGETWMGRLIAWRKDGGFGEVDAIITPVRDRHETTTTYVEVHHDVTEKVRLEEQLRQAQKLEAVGTLAGGIAHDFNNILAVIMGNAEMGLDVVPERTAGRRNLEQILKASKRGKDLVRQVLTFSHKFECDRRSVNLARLLEETVEVLKTSLPATCHVSLNLRIDSAFILGDPVELQQVVMNLANNACEAMENREEWLEITLSDAEFVSGPMPQLGMKPGSYIVLSLRDTGHGMDEPLMKRIFEPFFTTKRSAQRHGMGLSVVHGIVRSLHGAITVSSRPGEGSTFTLYFPKALDRIEKKAEQPGPIPVAGGKEHILFVDDDEALVELNDGLLKGLGYRVTALDDWSKALKRFERHPEGFDLVITDQIMPGMTGVELAKKLMAIRPGIRVILCTGHLENISPEEARATGICGFITKPATKEEMAELIQRCLTGSGSG